MSDLSLKGTNDIALTKGGISSENPEDIWEDFLTLEDLINEMHTFRDDGLTYTGDVDQDGYYTAMQNMSTCTCNSRTAVGCSCQSRTECDCNINTYTCSCNVRGVCSCDSRGSCVCNSRGCVCQSRNGWPACTDYCSVHCHCNNRTTSCECNLRSTSCYCDLRTNSCDCVTRGTCDCNTRTVCECDLRTTEGPDVFE